jgi:hypothetical protein
MEEGVKEDKEIEEALFVVIFGKFNHIDANKARAMS